MEEQPRAALLAALERMLALSIHQTGVLNEAATALGLGNFNSRLLNSALTPSQLARRLIADRRRREMVFDADLFADAAWDILLDLFAAHGEGEKVTVSSLCIAASVPPTTGLRYIGQLQQRGLIEKMSDAQDGRRVYAALTLRGRVMMQSYLAGIAHRWGINLAVVGSV